MRKSLEDVKHMGELPPPTLRLKEILDCVDFGKTVFLSREDAEKAIGGKEDV